MIQYLITHDGFFHLDDVFAYCVLKICYPNATLIRTRDKAKLLGKNEVVFDVFQKYEPENLRFDHHQTEGAGKRENGVPYAAAGLIWKHFGKRAIEQRLPSSMEETTRIWEEIDERIVQEIDASDNGDITDKPRCNSANIQFPGLSLSKILTTFNNPEEKDQTPEFLECAQFVSRFLEKSITREYNTILDEAIWKEEYEATKDKRILCLPKSLNWKKFAKEHQNVLYVIFPEGKEAQRWFCCATSTPENPFQSKVPFPETWGGKENEDLQKETGEPEAVFCHRNLFLCVTKSASSALTLAEASLKEHEEKQRLKPDMEELVETLLETRDFCGNEAEAIQTWESENRSLSTEEKMTAMQETNRRWEAFKKKAKE